MHTKNVIKNVIRKGRFSTTKKYFRKRLYTGTCAEYFGQLDQGALAWIAQTLTSWVPLTGLVSGWHTLPTGNIFGTVFFKPRQK